MTDTLFLSAEQITNALHQMCALAEIETLKHFRAPLNVSNKLDAGFDPVTIADKAAESVIRAFIMEHFPNHGILGEEEAPRNETADYCWIIDPIDGTRAYISGLPTWGTLIGLNLKGKPIAGVMHQPFIGEKYFTGGEASFLHHQNSQKTLTTSVTKTLDQATIMTTAPELFLGQDQKAFEAISSKCQLMRFGFDCYAYAMVASGNIELVVECGLNAYDIAPLIPLIENAGGVVCAWDGNSGAKGGKVVAAANNDIMQASLDILMPFS